MNKHVVAAGLGLLLAGALVGSAVATVKMVTVHLRDGTTVEGTVRSEDAAQITVVSEFAAGTISQTLTIPRTNVVEVAVWTPEQVVAWQMGRDYRDLQRYHLNASTSYRLAYYNQVIEGAFRPFLARYPNSPWDHDVLERLAQWETERDQVAAGNVKIRGQWVSPEARRGNRPGEKPPAGAGPLTKDETSVLGDIGTWLRNYWPVVAGAAAIGLWLLGRAFNR